MKTKLKKRAAPVCAIVFVVFALCTLASAQCKPGDILIGEDDRYWYCASRANEDEIKGVVKDLDNLLLEGPNSMLGEEWRFRRRVIDSAASLARQGYPTVNGGKLRITSEGKVINVCVSKECSGQSLTGIDCSGLLEYATRFSACFVDGFYRASGRAMAGLVEKNAEQQAIYFQQNKAFLPGWTKPNPGDAIFFVNTTENSRKDEITHVAIYLGKNSEGKTLVIHPSSRARKVVIARLDKNLEGKIIGYGNISKLFINTIAR